MEIPENWQEELMLRDWKMMRIERCKDALGPGSPWYHFPNGIHLQYSKIKVDFERAPAVVAALSDWEPEMKVRKGITTIKVNWDRYKSMTVGESEDFKWLLYSLEI